MLRKLSRPVGLMHCSRPVATKAQDTAEVLGDG